MSTRPTNNSSKAEGLTDKTPIYLDQVNRTTVPSQGNSFQWKDFPRLVATLFRLRRSSSPCINRTFSSYNKCLDRVVPMVECHWIILKGCHSNVRKVGYNKCETVGYSYPSPNGSAACYVPWVADAQTRSDNTGGHAQSAISKGFCAFSFRCYLCLGFQYSGYF